MITDLAVHLSELVIPGDFTAKKLNRMIKSKLSV